jgi:hypothetical protein
LDDLYGEEHPRRCISARNIAHAHCHAIAFFKALLYQAMTMRSA